MQPTATDCHHDCRPMKMRPAFRMPMVATPIAIPSGRPAPPARLTPPTAKDRGLEYRRALANNDAAKMVEQVPTVPLLESRRGRRGARRSRRWRKHRPPGRSAGRAGRSPARPCCEAAWSPRSPLPPTAFCMAWLSSKMITPSKSEPNHSTICRTRESFSPRSSVRSVA